MTTEETSKYATKPMSDKMVEFVRKEDYDEIAAEILALAVVGYDPPPVFVFRKSIHEFTAWYPGAAEWGKPVPYEGACGNCGRHEDVHPTMRLHEVGWGYAADGSDLDSYKDAYARAKDYGN